MNIKYQNIHCQIEMAKGSRGFDYVFLDAEGTIYIPRAGKSCERFWSEGDQTLDRALTYFKPVENVQDILERIRRAGIKLVVVSKHRPRLLFGILDKFSLLNLFQDVLVGEDKGDLIASYLEERGLSKARVLMVGDTPSLDVEPVRRAGIRAVLISQDRDGGGETLSSLEELLHYLGVE